MSHASSSPGSVSELPARILSAAADGVLWLDLDGRIGFANPAGAALLAAGVDDLVGEPVRSHMPFLNLGAGGDLLLLPEGDALCWRQDGTSFPVEYALSPVREGGSINGWVVTFRDVSRRRAAERATNELLAVASHELRSPLTAIRGALGLLAGAQLNTDSAQGRRMLEIALANTDRLLRLVNDTLDLERLESGRAGLNLDMCDADQLMVEAADAVRPLAEAAGVVLEVAPLEARLAGDADRLVQVLINLLANAIKFSPIDGGTVRLDAEQRPGELVFHVRDQGRGIPADKLETIFDRFAQVEAGDSRTKGGTGLGLAISRSIVNQHHGQIWAESAPGSGTTIFVALPCEAVISELFEAEAA